MKYLTYRYEGGAIRNGLNLYKKGDPGSRGFVLKFFRLSIRYRKAIKTKRSYVSISNSYHEYGFSWGNDEFIKLKPFHNRFSVIMAPDLDQALFNDAMIDAANRPIVKDECGDIRFHTNEEIINSMSQGK